MRTLLTIILLLLSAQTARSTELVMFETAYCEWCVKWDREIGRTYHSTKAGKTAPLRRVEMAHGRPDDLKFVKPVIYYPTFVIVKDSTEYGRIIGYQGKEKFRNQLSEILSRMPE